MSEHTIVLEGIVKSFTKSYSGNLSFMLEDSQNNLHYCFSTKKRPALSPSDKIVVIGSTTTGNKVRINYLINQSRNTEESMLEASNDWMYYVSLVSAISVTIGFVVAILYSLGIFTVDYGYMGIFGSIYTMIISIVLIILLLPTMIIFWVLTNSFSKKRKSAVQLAEDVSRIKENLSGSVKSSIKSPEVMKELTSVQKQEDSYSLRPQFCAHCGTKMSFEAKFCPSCGSEQ